MGLLIDSTVFVTAERRQQTAQDVVATLLEDYGDLEVALSVMSAGELVHGCWRADSAPRRARREEFVGAILAAIPVVPLTLAIARCTANSTRGSPLGVVACRPRISSSPRRRSTVAMSS